MHEQPSFVVHTGGNLTIAVTQSHSKPCLHLWSQDWCVFSADSKISYALDCKTLRKQTIDYLSPTFILKKTNLLLLPWFQISHWPPQSHTALQCTRVPQSPVWAPPEKSLPASGFSRLGLHLYCCKILEAKTWKHKQGKELAENW